jgi:hypothetical protein
MNKSDDSVYNRGNAVCQVLQNPKFPNADEVIRKGLLETRHKEAVDVLLVNPPSPDGGIWIRSQHRVGRRSRENMLWPKFHLLKWQLSFTRLIKLG